jgi:hypothetical protein
MLNESQFLLLSADEAHRLPDQDLRRAFCTIVKELTAVWGYWAGPANDVSVIAEQRDPETLSTSEMRQIVAENQYWFNVPELRA